MVLGVGGEDFVYSFEETCQPYVGKGQPMVLLTSIIIIPIQIYPWIGPQILKRSSTHDQDCC